jgi:hypothetical protein
MTVANQYCASVHTSVSLWLKGDRTTSSSKIVEFFYHRGHGVCHRGNFIEILPLMVIIPAM